MVTGYIFCGPQCTQTRNYDGTSDCANSEFLHRRSATMGTRTSWLWLRWPSWRPWSVSTSTGRCRRSQGGGGASRRCLQARTHTHATTGRSCMANCMEGREGVFTNTNRANGCSGTTRAHAPTPPLGPRSDLRSCRSRGPRRPENGGARPPTKQNVVVRRVAALCCARSRAVLHGNQSMTSPLFSQY